MYIYPLYMVGGGEQLIEIAMRRLSIRFWIFIIAYLSGFFSNGHANWVANCYCYGRCCRCAPLRFLPLSPLSPPLIIIIMMMMMMLILVAIRILSAAIKAKGSKATTRTQHPATATKWHNWIACKFHKLLKKSNLIFVRTNRTTGSMQCKNSF